MGTIANDFSTDAAITYTNSNGAYVFSPALKILRVVIRPVLDQAKRTVTHSVYTITVEDIVQAVDQADGTKVDTSFFRRVLQYPGGGLTVQGIGLGDFSVNTPPFSVIVNPNAIKYDCIWGPIPTELSWEDYGNGKAGKMVWQVTTAIAEQCADAKSKLAIMAYNYDALWSKDIAGYQHRTITGYVEIPMTRASYVDRTPPDTVDRLRESCYPDVPVGWKRSGDSWKVSMDRRRADFNYTDEEQPYNAPAEGVVNCEETVAAESSGNILGNQIVTLSGTYEMAKTRQRAESWYHFTRFCQDRRDAIIAGFAENLKNVPPNKQSGCVIIPIKLRMEEPVHSRTSGKFSLTLSHTMPMATFDLAIANAIAASSLFVVPTEGGQDWTKWNDSMKKEGVYTARGVANTSFQNDASTDTIIDLCLTAKTPLLLSAKFQVKAPTFGPATIDFPTPTPPLSFLKYIVGMLVEDFDSVTELKPLPTEKLIKAVLPGNSNSPISNSGGGNDQGSLTGYLPLYPNTPKSVMQERCGSHTAVTVYGAALRAGYLITPPVLNKIGGVAAVRQNREGNFFRQWLWGNFGIPIVAALWSQRYLLPSPPKNYGLVPNDLMSLASPNPLLFSG